MYDSCWGGRQYLANIYTIGEKEKRRVQIDLLDDFSDNLKGVRIKDIPAADTREKSPLFLRNWIR